MIDGIFEMFVDLDFEVCVVLEKVLLVGFGEVLDGFKFVCEEEGVVLMFVLFGYIDKVESLIDVVEVNVVICIDVICDCFLVKIVELVDVELEENWFVVEIVMLMVKMDVCEEFDCLCVYVVFVWELFK